MRTRWLGWSGIGALVLGAAVLLAMLSAPDRTGAQEPAPGKVVRIFSVGGVLTADGTLWQYTPDEGWQTIDRAFRDQGRETKILPLPVPVERIADMITFGFILTDTGECWLYDLDHDEWKKLEAPH